MPRSGHYEAVCQETVHLLKEERERQKLSRYAVAQRSGVSESMLSLVERGLSLPSLEVLLRMADGLGANLPEFLARAMKGVQPSTKPRK